MPERKGQWKVKPPICCMRGSCFKGTSCHLRGLFKDHLKVGSMDSLCFHLKLKFQKILVGQECSKNVSIGTTWSETRISCGYLGRMCPDKGGIYPRGLRGFESCLVDVIRM